MIMSAKNLLTFPDHGITICFVENEGFAASMKNDRMLRYLYNLETMMKF